MYTSEFSIKSYETFLKKYLEFIHDDTVVLFGMTMILFFCQVSIEVFNFFYFNTLLFTMYSNWVIFFPIPYNLTDCDTSSNVQAVWLLQFPN